MAKKRFSYDGSFAFIYEGGKPLLDTEERPNRRIDALMRRIGDVIAEAGFEFDYTSLSEPRELADE